MMNDHIHKPDDGRGARDVFVNGNFVECAVYADTRLGFVIYTPRPFRRAKNKDYVYTRKLKGRVEVVDK